MTWTRSEAEEQEHYANHGGRVVEFRCPDPICRTVWEAVTRTGDELDEDADECPICGKQGEEL